MIDYTRPGFYVRERYYTLAQRTQALGRARFLEREHRTNVDVIHVPHVGGLPTLYETSPTEDIYYGA